MLTKVKPTLQSSIGRSSAWGGAKLVNCFAEKGEGDQRDLYAVMLIPGLVEFCDLGMNIRGIHRMADTLYVVADTQLYSVDSTGTATLIGTIPGTGRVAMADNGVQLGIVSGTNGYVLSSGTITTPTNLPSVSDVDYIDGYMLWTVAGSDQFVISALNDATSYDPLDVGVAEGSPDGLVGVIVDHREVQLYGKRTIEIFYNSGASDFPFDRQGNAFIERGCLSRDSLVKIDNSVMFMGDDRVCYRLDGYNPIRVSTHAKEYAWRNATDFWAYTYTQEGHKFYVLCTDVGTFAFDIATGLWHDRQSSGMDNWRAGFAENVYGQTIFADHDGSKLYTGSLDVFEEDGNPIAMEVTVPVIESPDRRRLTFYAFEMTAETGVGLNSGQGSDPQVMLSWSDDGGHTWSNELWRSLGAIGAYRTRAVWRKLGQAWQRQFRFRITDPVRRVVLGYYVDAR